MNKPFTPPFLPPVGMENDASIQQLLSQADRVLGKFEGMLLVLPEPRLLIAPMMRREAVNSAQIEGSQATMNDVLLYEADGNALGPEQRDDYQEIVNYRQTLREAEGKLKTFPFDLWLLRGMHETLLSKSVRGSQKEPGTIRTRQNWIGPPGAFIDQASYVPPPPEKIPELMGDWLAYWHKDPSPPLLKMAVLHGQFETIHPFLDGNGRIGRLLLPLFLVEQKVLPYPVFYLSQCLLARREEYYHHLRGLNTQSGKWREWVAFFLSVCVQQGKDNIATAQAILALRKELKHDIQPALNSRYAADLIDAIFIRPVFSLRGLKFPADKPGDATLNRLLKILADNDVLRELRSTSQGRPSIYRFPKLLNILESRQSHS